MGEVREGEEERVRGRWKEGRKEGRAGERRGEEERVGGKEGRGRESGREGGGRKGEKE